MKTNDIRIELPPSKSHSIRWLFANCLSPYNFHIKNLSKAEDVEVAQRVIGKLEAGKECEFDCGESGLVSRILVAILALREGEYVVKGDKRLCERPIAPLVDALVQLGGPQVTYLGKKGCLPVRIVGAVPEKKLAVVEPAVSGQFVSALLYGAAQLEEGLIVRMKGCPASKPYIEMTCRVLSEAGASNDYKATHTTIRQQSMLPFGKVREVTIERDWSAAAYFYMAALFLPKRRIRLVGLSLNTLQGDVAAVELFKKLGVITKEVRSPYKNGCSVTIEGGGEIAKQLTLNVNDTPDLMPTVAVACAAMGVDCYIKGIDNLKYKESDRAEAVMTELEKMGCKVEVDGDVMHLPPSAMHPQKTVRTYGDHRMAMAFGVLKIMFPDLVIEDKEVVNKSFPGFWDQLEKLL